MNKSDGNISFCKPMDILSRLLLQPSDENARAPRATTQVQEELQGLRGSELKELQELAESNHVIVRAMEAILETIRGGKNTATEEWALHALATERSRIATAMVFLENICGAFHAGGCEVAVIKSLDHWPDLGSDLDLFTTASFAEVWKILQRFEARILPRSWGDRLACKFNFRVAGLQEAIEIHIGRLGQTGEHVSIAGPLMQRTRAIHAAGRVFRVPSISDQLMISAMQRMYRHFYFRLCDIVDTGLLADAGEIDYEELRELAARSNIWSGVATYLRIVSDYWERYRGGGLDLPGFVAASASFGGEDVYYDRRFLRIPILPQSARLYGLQLVHLLGRGELCSGARLSLLPGLATAAVIGQRLTGSDKGIW